MKKFMSIHWKVGSVTVYLWPFVYVAVAVAALALYDHLAYG